MVPATDFFTAGATTLNTLATGSALYAAGLTPIVQAGFGCVLLSNGTSVGLTADRLDKYNRSLVQQVLLQNKLQLRQLLLQREPAVAGPYLLQMEPL